MQGRYNLTPLSYEALDHSSSFASEQCPEGFCAVAKNTLRILSLERLGESFNQQVCTCSQKNLIRWSLQGSELNTLGMESPLRNFTSLSYVVLCYIFMTVGAGKHSVTGYSL